MEYGSPFCRNRVKYYLSEPDQATRQSTDPSYQILNYFGLETRSRNMHAGLHSIKCYKFGQDKK